MPDTNHTPKATPISPTVEQVEAIATSIARFYDAEMDLRDGGPAAHQLAGTAGEPGSVRIIARNRRDPYNDLGKPDGPWGVAIRALIRQGSGPFTLVHEPGAEAIRVAREREAITWMRCYEFRSRVTIEGWQAAIDALVDQYNREVADAVNDEA
ncbi:MAG: hypothetical protein WC869_16585 [Phycisphaerae bacterium]|jgi:hypothetical protein